MRENQSSKTKNGLLELEKGFTELKDREFKNKKKTSKN